VSLVECYWAFHPGRLDDVSRFLAIPTLLYIIKYSGNRQLTNMHILIVVWLGSISAKLRQTSSYKTDDRILIMNEFIKGVRVIKMYAWDDAFFQKIMNARKYDGL
jgi:hypothetical protein